LDGDEIWSEKVRCSLKIKPRLQAEWVVSSKVTFFGKLLFKSIEEEFSLKVAES